MIRVVKGDIFSSDADVLVNTVNTKGIMEAGVAKQFKQRFPDMFEDYRRACYHKQLYVSARFEVDLSDPSKPKLKVHKVYDYKPHIYPVFHNGKKVLILNLPTKIYWDLPSDYKLVDAGVKWIKDNIELLESRLGRSINKIAMSKLGCGCGKLD